MKIINRLDEILAIIAKSSMSDQDYKIISNRIKDIKREFDLSDVNISVNRISEIIVNYLKVPEDYHTRKQQTRDLVIARQFAAVFMVKYANKTKSDIGKFFEKKHDFVIHCEKTLKNLCETDRLILNQYNDIDYRITIKYIEK